MTKKSIFKDSNKPIACISCGLFKKIHARGLCNRCYKNDNAKSLVEKSLLKKCECSETCNEMIHSITLRGKERKYADGHFYRSNRNPKFKGGKKTSTGKYPMLYMPWHPNSEKSGYVYEHVWKMSVKIKRPLNKGEVVHHVDGNVKNNDISNLQLFSSHSEHMSATTRQNNNDRVCSNPKCNNEGKTTVDKNGYRYWYDDLKGGYECKNCYRRRNYKLKKR